MARMFFKLVAGSVLIGLSLGAWACAGDDGADDDSDVESLTVVAENTLFSPEKISVPTGQEVTLKVENRDTIEHDLEVEGLAVEVIEGGSERPEHGGDHGSEAGILAVHTEGEESASITFVARDPGTYEFYCTIPGHRESGMVGILAVD